DGIVAGLGGVPQEGRRTLRALRKGDRVKEGQTLAILDNDLAMSDMEIKEAKILSAKADLEATRKTAAEAMTRYKRQEKLHKMLQISEEEFSGAKLTVERYAQEAVSKEQAVRVAELEFRQAQIILGMY